MIKRTLYFGNPSTLNTKNEQLLFKNPETGETKELPIEDIGILIIDHHQITISQALLIKCLANNIAFITCDKTHHPTGMFLNLDGNSLQSSKFQSQIEASVPLKKQIWQQTIMSKIQNQASILKKEGIPVNNMLNWASSVKSGDSDNREGTAASYYWKNIFPEFLDFRRERFGPPPNNLLNYGYALIRAIAARSLVASGLLPTLGIFHKNQYNSYCLADDIMEPYRPFVDQVVLEIINLNGKFLELTPSMKKKLLMIPTMDVMIKGEKSPLMIAMQKTTSSLARCFENKVKKIDYPSFPD